jgi:dephospho-CoA kinase
MKIVGLTGGACTGVSTAGEILVNKLNVPVLVVKEATQKMNNPGSVLLLKLATEFGKDVLNEDGTLNKEHVLNNIIADKKLYKKFTTVITDAISSWTLSSLLELRSSGHDIVFVESNNITPDSQITYEDVLVITCSPEAQVRRLKNNKSDDEVKHILDTQLPLSEIEKLGTYVVDTTNTDLESLEELLRLAVEDIRDNVVGEDKDES